MTSNTITNDNQNNGKQQLIKDSEDSDFLVGFYDLPHQMASRRFKKSFELSLMVVGESGLGKSTFLNSMFLTDIYCSEYPGPSKRAHKTVEVETTKVLLKEKSVNLHLTIVDTPGFGCAVNNDNCWEPIINFIESRNEEYFKAEMGFNRSQIHDNRVHCCLYFINPSGHSLKLLDIECLTRLHDKVNIIPVIAKADTMTSEECLQFKKNITNELNANEIKFYEFPDFDDEEEEESVRNIDKNRAPFAVVGSNYVIEVNAERKRVRIYPWGVVDIEDNFDFVALRYLLIRKYMLDLVDITHNVHYENYRSLKLRHVPLKSQGAFIRNILLKEMADEEKAFDAEMETRNARLEMDGTKMEQEFQKKVKEMTYQLKVFEAELTREHEEEVKELELRQQQLKERRLNFEKERAAFEALHRTDSSPLN